MCEELRPSLGVRGPLGVEVGVEALPSALPKALRWPAFRPCGFINGAGGVEGDEADTGDRDADGTVGEGESFRRSVGESGNKCGLRRHERSSCSAPKELQRWRSSSGLGLRCLGGGAAEKKYPPAKDRDPQLIRVIVCTRKAAEGTHTRMLGGRRVYACPDKVAVGGALQLLAMFRG